MSLFIYPEKEGRGSRRSGKLRVLGKISTVVAGAVLLWTVKVGLIPRRREKGRCAARGNGEICSQGAVYPLFCIPLPCFVLFGVQTSCVPRSAGREAWALTDGAGTRSRSKREPFCQAEGREIPDKSCMTQRERQEPKSCPECREFTGMGKKTKGDGGKGRWKTDKPQIDSEKQKEPRPYRQWRILGRWSAPSLLTVNFYAHFVCVCMQSN